MNFVLSMFAFLLIGAIALYFVARGQRRAASTRTLSSDQTAAAVIAMTTTTAATAAPSASAVDCGGSAGSSCNGS